MRLTIGLLVVSMSLVPTLARAGTQAADHWSVITVAATSSLDAAHAPEHLFSNGYGQHTGWCAKKGDGLTERLTVTFAEPVELVHVIVDVGESTTAATSAKWNRPQTLTIAVNDEPAKTAEVSSDGRATAEVREQVTKVTVGFAKVKKGKHRASCLSSIFFDDGGNYENRFVLGSDPKAVATLSGDVAAIGAALAACDAAKLGATLQFPFPRTDGTPHKDTPSKKDKTTRYASSADLVKAKCDLPVFIGNVDDPQLYGTDGCFRAGVDAIDCQTESSEDKFWWHLRWSGGSWKAVGVTRLVGELKDE